MFAFLLSLAVSFVLYGFLFILWLLLAAFFVVWWNQEFILYQPTFQATHSEGRQTPSNPEGYRTPGEMGLPFEDVYVQTDDGVCVHGWLITQDQATDRPTILYCHGNAGNIGHRLPGLRELYYQAGCNIFIFDYRGYGNSGGSPSEEGLIMDAEAALEHLREKASVDSKNIIVFGRSLGGAVAIALTAKHSDQLRGLVLENTFTRIDDMATVLLSRITDIKRADMLLPFLHYYITNPWRSCERIGSISKPILFISGKKDQLIPPAQMRILYNGAAKAEFKWLHEVPNGDHNNTVDKGGDMYYEKFREFLTRVIVPASSKVASAPRRR